MLIRVLAYSARAPSQSASDRSNYSSRTLLSARYFHVWTVEAQRALANIDLGSLLA